jgi:hypothetical protein
VGRFTLGAKADGADAQSKPRLAMLWDRFR